MCLTEHGPEMNVDAVTALWDSRRYLSERGAFAGVEEGDLRRKRFREKLAILAHTLEIDSFVEKNIRPLEAMLECQS